MGSFYICNHNVLQDGTYPEEMPIKFLVELKIHCEEEKK